MYIVRKISKTDEYDNNDKFEFENVEMVLQWCSYVSTTVINKTDIIISAQTESETEKLVALFREKVRPNLYTVLDNNTIKLLGRKQNEKFFIAIRRTPYKSTMSTLPRIRAKLDKYGISYSQDGIRLFVYSQDTPLIEFKDGQVNFLKREEITEEDVSVIIKFFKAKGGFTNVIFHK